MTIELHLHPNDMAVSHERQVLALSPMQMRLLNALAEGPVRRADLADALGVSSQAAHSYVVTLRNKAARANFPLRLSVSPGSYALEAGLRIARRQPVSVEPDSLRLIVRLIDECNDPHLADTARRHFLGDYFSLGGKSPVSRAAA